MLPVPLDVAAYFTIGAIFLALMYLWAVASTAKIARRRIWDTAIMCLSPLLIVHAFTNWDLLAIGITAGAMLAWARKKPILAGALLGLGAAAKLYPILLLGPLLILCLRAGKMAAWTRAALAAAVVWLVINVPVLLAYPQGWYEFIRLNSERPPEYDSWYFIYATLTRSKIWDAAPGADSPTLVNLLSLALFLLACAAIGWLGLSAQRRPRFAQLAFLVIAAFLLTNKVWSPQYSLWLLPLAVLALPRWRPLLLWQASEAVVWVLLMLSFAGVANKGLSIYPFINAALVRDAMVLILVFLVVGTSCARPETWSAWRAMTTRRAACWKTPPIGSPCPRYRSSGARDGLRLPRVTHPRSRPLRLPQSGSTPGSARRRPVATAPRAELERRCCRSARRP